MKPTILEKVSTKKGGTGAVETTAGSQVVVTQANSTAEVVDTSAATNTSHACELHDGPVTIPATDHSAEAPASDKGDCDMQAAEKQPVSKGTELSAAYDANAHIRAMSGAMEGVSWSPRARAMLAGALSFLPLYKAADKSARRHHRDRLKQEGRKHVPYSTNCELMAVHSCIAATTVHEQKEWSRFACVVEVAASQGVLPDAADHFLDSRTLNQCVEVARQKDGPKKPRKKPVPVVLASSPTFAGLLSAKGPDAEWARAQLLRLEAEAKARRLGIDCGALGSAVH